MAEQLPTPQDTPIWDSSEQDPPSPASYPHHSTSWTPVDAMTPISTNPSRKRSRDESCFQDADGSYFPSYQVNTPAPIPEEEPIYGEGMVLLNPRTGHSISAESQTGTWLEEKEEEEAKNQPSPSSTDFRPLLPSSRKSIRLSKSSIAPVHETAISAPASPPKQPHPEVDEATIALGIGWTRLVSEDADIQAAARGWARYLENHYARYVHNAEILLKSKGLNAYLVGCQEGFYLFSENLLEGRLVGKMWTTCLENLRAQPIAFEGEEILKAERTPGPEFLTQAQSSMLQERMETGTDTHYQHLNGEANEFGVVVNGNGSGGMEID